MPIPMTSAQIIEDMTEKIRTGSYPPGSQLPSYNELAGTYGVGFTTIARVMSTLRERGVVVGVPGRGTFAPER